MSRCFNCNLSRYNKAFTITFDCLRISLIRLCHRYRCVLCSSHVSSNRKVESKGIAKSSDGTLRTLPQYHNAMELRQFCIFSLYGTIVRQFAAMYAVSSSQSSLRNGHSRQSVDLTSIQRKVLKAALACGVKGIGITPANASLLSLGAFF